MTALQKSALMGSIGLKVRAVPPSVANATLAQNPGALHAAGDRGRVAT
jgi:hypothetical protein